MVILSPLTLLVGGQVDLGRSGQIGVVWIRSRVAWPGVGGGPPLCPWRELAIRFHRSPRHVVVEPVALVRGYAPVVRGVGIPPNLSAGRLVAVLDDPVASYRVDISYTAVE